MVPPAAFELKNRLRREALSRRDALAAAWRRDASAAIARRTLLLPELVAAEPVGGYWPIRSEVDPLPIMEALAARGRDVALSQIVHPRLSWRLWRPGDPLVHGSFGLREPGPEAPECFPEALLVPLAAFDRRGGRIGYGKGYFDRSIAELSAHRPVIAIGLAFATQEVEAVPTEMHDHPLDIVVTERETLRLERD